ncbi:hypothetical protein Tco_0356394 [Tanacetum coccineum]
MTTLAEFMIIAGADNRPPMLEKSLYYSWKSPDGTTKTKKYEELSATEKIQADCDCKATNIVIQGLSPDVYAIVNHHKVIKEIWDRVKLLMQGTKLSLQEKECKLYDEFDKFTFVKGETLYQYYWRFDQLINNMNVINMSMRAVQVNTKFLNSLPPEWSKFVMDVKLARDLHTTNYDQLYSYLEQHVVHANEARLMSERYQDPLAFVANYNQPPPQLTNYHSQYNPTHVTQQINNMIPQVHSPQSFSPMPRNVAWFKEMAMLAKAQEARQILDEEQLAFLTDPGIPDGQAVQTTIPNTTAFQTKDLDVYDSDCDDVFNVKEKANQEKNNESVTAELERYKERVKTFKQRLNVDFSTRKKMIDSQMDDMIKEKLALKQEIDSLEQNLSNQIKERNLYCKHLLLVFDDEEASILEEVSRFKMLAKQNDPISKDKKVNTTLINYAELNRLSEDFGKCFIPQQELSDEQAFWLQTSHPNTDQSTSSPVKIEAPRELPKITPDAITEGAWGFEHTKTVFLNEIIPFLKTLKDIFNVFDEDILNEVMKVQTVFNQMEATVQQYFVDKKCFEIQNKEFFLENDRLLQKIMSQDVMICVMNSIALFDDVNVEMQSSESCVKCLNLDAELLNKQNKYNDLSKQYFKNNDLKAQLQAKDTTIYKLKEHIKSMRENDKEKKVKHEMDEIETINIKLEHSVAKLLSENELLHKEIKHLKKIYKDQFDSIKKMRALSKEHGLKCSTSTCRSQPIDNKKNDRILQKPSSNRKNKVEAQPRKVNKKNRVKEPICDNNVKHTMLNVNS